MQLKDVVPFGRSLNEYRAMFDLSQEDLSTKILGVGDGPASFNSEMTQLGHHVLSVDPLYAFAGQEIEQQFHEVVEDVIAQVRDTPSDWVWTYHQSPDDLRKNRLAALHTFLADYELGKKQMRYVIGELPHLSHVHDATHGLALCSHFLFLYSDQFGLEFHKAALYEMLRVASEVRVFPLLTLKGERSPYIEPVVHSLERQGFQLSIQRVEYELQRGGNEMLVVKRR